MLAVYGADGALLARFLYADGRTPYAADTPDGRRYLSYDQVASLTAVTDETGAVLRRVERDSFGNAVSDTAPGVVPWLGFAGGMPDAETGLVHFGARDYDPALGRWVSKDPIGFSGGDADLFAYCGGDPVAAVDPSGLITLPAPSVPVALGVQVPIPGMPSVSIPLGEEQGQQAVDYWAMEAERPGNQWWQTAGANVGLGLSSLWTPCSSDKTATTLAASYGVGRWLGRPYWQYYPAENPGYSSNWLTRGTGWSPPYALGSDARSALNLPSYNTGTAVRQVQVPMWRFVGGPTLEPVGGGTQYLMGGWPPGPMTSSF